MHAKKFNMIYLGVVLMAAAIMLVLSSCTAKSKLDTGSDSGVPDSIDISASPALITSGGTAVVEATVLSEDGSGISNEIVAFSVVPASAGSFTPAIDTTDVAGDVATVFTADTSGAFTITAEIVGSTLSSSVQLSVQAADGDSSDGTASITINTSTILLVANGQDTAQITVTVFDALGQPAADGTAIRIVAGEKFTDADGDGYWSEGIDTLTFDANGDGEWTPTGTIPATAIISGGTGQVTVDYVSGTTPGAVFVRATVDDNGLVGTRELSLQIQPNSNIIISADPILLLASGTDTSQITITIRDGNNQLAPESTFCAIVAGEKFNDVDGNGYWSEGIDSILFDANGNGQWDALGLIPSTAVTPDNLGTITVDYVAGLSPATVFIKITVNDNGISGCEELSLQALSTEGVITWDADLSILLANGVDQSQITMTVRDALGQPAPDNVLIKLVAGDKFLDVDGNGIWSVGIDMVTHDVNDNELWDVIGQIPSSVLISGGLGQATVTYTSATTPGPVYVKATVEDVRIHAASDHALQLVSDTALNSIYMGSDSMQLVVTQTGGIETGLLRAVGYDMFGNRVWAGVPIDFVILNGPGGGEQLDSVGYGPYRAYTDVQGVATASFHTGTVSGTVRIRAYSGTVLSNATQVLISAGPPKHIVVAHEHCNVDFWDNVAGENVITAIVSDTFLNPVNDSTVVWFTTDEGTVMSHMERTEDHQGIANTIWFSGNNVDTANGRVIIYAETAGGTVADTNIFFNTHFPDTMKIWGWQTNIRADGESYFSVWITAVDLNGNPVIGGTEFDAEARILAVNGGIFQDGCYSASDRVKVSSKTLKVDESMPGGNDDGWGVIDFVTFWHPGGAGVTGVCSLSTGFAYTGNSTINMQSNATPGETVYITVTVEDRWGNPLGDHTLNLTASGGTVTGGTQETDAYGEATGFTWTGGIGDYTIVVNDTDPRGGIILTSPITVEP